MSAFRIVYRLSMLTGGNPKDLSRSIVEWPAIAGLLDENTRRYYDAFSRCESCGRIYWKGSHYARLRALVEALTGKIGER